MAEEAQPIVAAPAIQSVRLGVESRSSKVRAIAVMGILFGTLGLSCLPFNLGAFITYGWPIQGNQTSMLDAWCLASTFAGLALAMILLFSSLGCYHFKAWGRYGMLFWASASVAYGIVGIYFWGQFLLPWLAPHNPTMRGPDEVGGLVAWIIGTALALFTLHTLTRSSVRALFT